VCQNIKEEEEEEEEKKNKRKKKKKTMKKDQIWRRRNKSRLFGKNSSIRKV
jgi:hypothetical protein